MNETNDTHGVAGKGWYGFDLDGTLAVYDGWKGCDHIGEPVKLMVDRIQRYCENGETVKIVTARVAPRPDEYGNLVEQSATVKDEEDGVVRSHPASYFIRKWCEKHLGFVPEITYKKDHLMLWLFDDRSVQVERNTGRILGVMPGALERAKIDMSDYKDLYERCVKDCGRYVTLFNELEACFREIAYGSYGTSEWTFRKLHEMFVRYVRRDRIENALVELRDIRAHIDREKDRWPAPPWPRCENKSPTDEEIGNGVSKSCIKCKNNCIFAGKDKIVICNQFEEKDK